MAAISVHSPVQLSSKTLCGACVGQIAAYLRLLPSCEIPLSTAHNAGSLPEEAWRWGKGPLAPELDRRGGRGR